MSVYGYEFPAFAIISFELRSQGLLVPGPAYRLTVQVRHWDLFLEGSQKRRNTLALLFGNRAEVRHLIFVHFQGIGVMTTVNMTNRHCLSEFTANGTMLDRR